MHRIHLPARCSGAPRTCRPPSPSFLPPKHWKPQSLGRGSLRTDHGVDNRGTPEVTRAGLQEGCASGARAPPDNWDPSLAQGRTAALRGWTLLQGHGVTGLLRATFLGDPQGSGPFARAGPAGRRRDPVSSPGRPAPPSRTAAGCEHAHCARAASRCRCHGDRSPAAPPPCRRPADMAAPHARGVRGSARGGGSRGEGDPSEGALGVPEVEGLGWEARGPGVGGSGVRGCGGGASRGGGAG